MEFFINNLYTIIFFPLWVFLLIVIGRFFDVIASKKVIFTLTLTSTLYGFIFSLGSFIYLLKTPNFSYENSYTFLKIEDYSLNFGVYADNLSVMMLLLITTISFIVQFYSTNYMAKDKSFSRFFSYLNLFNFAMIGLVLSPNLFQNYVFWELVGVASYLLIGFWYKKPSASDAAKKAFIMNRIGDFGLLIGTIAVSYYMYQYSGSLNLSSVPFSNIGDIASYLYSYTGDLTYILICILILMGAIAKSAQFPLHTWLADAMEGPTPVSALIHSATMVAAGVYLVARLYPVFVLSDVVMNFIAIIGLITALICAFFAITQNDLKRILAYSTNSQLGLMFLVLGAGAYSGGLFHLVTHAYFKSMLFLCSGIVIHSIGQQDIRFMGGLRKYMPLTAACYLIGCLSIAGLVFSGFYSKELMLKSLFEFQNPVYSIGFLLTAVMTAFYMFRSYFLVFEGKEKSENQISEPNIIFNLSISILAIVTMVLGCIIHLDFDKFIKFGEVVSQNIKHNPLIASMSASLLGLFFAIIFYTTKFKAFKVPVLYKLSYRTLYIDNIYRFIAGKLYYVAARICALTDKYLVDGLVMLCALNVRAFSWVCSKMQTGNFQSYLAYSVAFLAFVFAVLMLAYTVIVNTGIISSY